MIASVCETRNLVTAELKNGAGLNDAERNISLPNWNCEKNNVLVSHWLYTYRCVFESLSHKSLWFWWQRFEVSFCSALPTRKPDTGSLLSAATNRARRERETSKGYRCSYYLFSKREDSRLQQQSQAGETRTGAGCLKLGSRLVHSELNWQNHKLQ